MMLKAFSVSSGLPSAIALASAWSRSNTGVGTFHWLFLNFGIGYECCSASTGDTTIAGLVHPFCYCSNRLLFPVYSFQIYCEKPLSVGKGIWLYHNTAFQIGDTTFTYIERDL